MINELYHLSQSLEHCGITTEKIHPWIQPPKKGAGLRVILNQTAHVKKVEYLNKEDVSSLWNIKQSNHKMFPVINLKTPLWKVQEQSDVEQLLEFRNKKRSVAESIECVSHIIQKSDFCFTKAQDVLNKIYKLPHEALSMLVGEDEQEFSAFSKLIEICANLNEEDAIVSMIDEFSDKFLEALQFGRIDDYSLMHSVFFGKWQEKKNSFGEESITIFFDIDYTEMIDLNFWEISSTEMKTYINRRLFETQKDEGDESFGVTDAFGKQGRLVTKQPQPNLPIVGPSYLMSMNKDAPCHAKYGNIGCSVFPITENLANAMSDAVIYLTQNANKRKTWEKVPCGKVGENDLLLVYLQEMPDVGVEFANAFGTGVENKDFEDSASVVCETLYLKLGNLDSALIRLLLLQSVSKGQRVVRFETGFTVKELDKAVKFWCDSGRNIPSFYLPLKIEGKKGKFKRVSPRAPFPVTMFDSLQFQWLNNGSNRKDIKGGRLGDMYQLFLHPNSAHATRYLELLLRRTTPFLVRFKQAQGHRSLRPWKEKEYEAYKKIVLDSIAFVGILLKILGRKKEVYMKSSGYYIGRLLSLADLLHEQYCIHVRNGGDVKKGLPPQLLGNSLMRGAMDNPVQALARLQERLTVYSAWAKKEQGERSKLAKWAMGEMGKVSEALSDLELPTRTNDMMKAEILLGYLAKPEKKEGGKIMSTEQLNRATGLLIIEVINSNPNGDPDRESDPRQRPDERGEISPVSFKRKLRDLVEGKEGPVWQELKKQMNLNDEEFMILEHRGRDRKAIEVELKDGTFVRKYWDARVFGNTFLEEGSSTSIKTGAVQFGMGVSIAPILIERQTTTNKAGVQEGKDRGMAPLAYRIVQHGVYCMPFFVNASAAQKSGCTKQDVELMLKLIPYAYPHNASYIRPAVEIRHAWYMEHQGALGSCSDFTLIEFLTPQKLEDPDRPSTSWKDYQVPTKLPEELAGKLLSVKDLMKGI